MTKKEWFNLSEYGRLTQEHINQWLSEGNSIDEKEEYGYGFTALIYFCCGGNIKANLQLAQLLLQNSADVNIQDDDGETALMKACLMNHYKIAQLLIEYGANVNLQSNDQWTALMIACNWGDYEITKLLLEKGANPYLLNEENKSAYDYGDDKIKQLLPTGEASRLILEQHPYYLHKSIKKYINKQNKNIQNIKKLNLPLIKKYEY